MILALFQECLLLREVRVRLVFEPPLQFLVLQGLLEELLRGLGCSRLLIQVLAQPQRIFLAQLLLVAHMAVVVVVRGLKCFYGPFLLSHQR